MVAAFLDEFSESQFFGHSAFPGLTVELILNNKRLLRITKVQIRYFIQFSL